MSADSDQRLGSTHAAYMQYRPRPRGGRQPPRERRAAASARGAERTLHARYSTNRIACKQGRSGTSQILPLCLVRCCVSCAALRSSAAAVMICFSHPPVPLRRGERVQRVGLDAYRLQLGVSLDDETVGVSLDDETGCCSLVSRIQPLGSPLSPMP